MSTQTDYAPSILRPLIPVLRSVISDPDELALVERLASWKGDYPVDSVGATLFNQFLFDLTEETFHDELGDALFETLLSTRALDSALPPGRRCRFAVVEQPQFAPRRKPRQHRQGGLAGQRFALAIAVRHQSG